ncbi:MAG: DUF3592 domain-containing protein [Planctomycetota bacterium]|nr:DUF3592 domain-containing protein [Planctomycetota bacterium]
MLKNPSSKPLSSKRSPFMAVLPIILMGCFFIGLGVWGLFSFNNVVTILAARTWTPTRCTIESSAIVPSGTNRRGPVLRLAIHYTYVINGKTHGSDRYDCDADGPSGNRAKQITELHPAGSETTCYVNPQDPSQAMLEREFRWIHLLDLLVIPPLGIGGLCLFAASRCHRELNLPRNNPPARTGTAPAPERLSSLDIAGLPAPPTSTNGRVALSPIDSAWNLLFQVSIAIGIFGGLAAFCLCGLTLMKAPGSSGWLIAILMIPFILVILPLLIISPFFLRTCLVPQPDVFVSAGLLHPGETARLECAFTRRPSAIRKWAVDLKAREEVDYFDKDNKSRTTKNTIYSRRLTASKPKPISTNWTETIDVAIPSGAMHSFESPRNRIVWYIEVDVTISDLRSRREEYRIVVLPLQTHSRASA